MRGNAICERIIGTLRRELSGRLLIVNEHHLRRVLTEYLRHHNTARPHRALGQLAPTQADTQPPQINLAEHRIRRNQSSADSYTSTRPPPEARQSYPKTQVTSPIVYSSPTGSAEDKSPADSRTSAGSPPDRPRAAARRHRSPPRSCIEPKQAHLRRILHGYETHHNQHRPRRSLHGAAPLKPLPEPVDLDQDRARNSLASLA